MEISARQLREMLLKNPALHIVQQGGKPMEPLETVKENKYRNIKVYVYSDGFVSESKSGTQHGKIAEVYDSIKEYTRWGELQMLRKAGKISDLKRQVVYEIQPSFIYRGVKIKAINYKADFQYKIGNGNIVVEDVKGFDATTKKYKTTAEFDLKWKLLKFRYPDIVFLLY